MRDVAASVLPVGRGAALPRLLPRRLRREVGRHEQQLDLAVPAVLVEIAPLEPRVDLRELSPGVVL
jgi:hypothetical protein